MNEDTLQEYIDNYDAPKNELLEWLSTCPIKVESYKEYPYSKTIHIELRDLR
jgi:hypothetical protein